MEMVINDGGRQEEAQQGYRSDENKREEHHGPREKGVDMLFHFYVELINHHLLIKKKNRLCGELCS